MACLQVFLLWEEPIAAVCQATREEPMEQVTSSVPASFHTPARQTKTLTGVNRLLQSARSAAQGSSRHLYPSFAPCRRSLQTHLTNKVLIQRYWPCPSTRRPRQKFGWPGCGQKARGGWNFPAVNRWHTPFLSLLFPQSLRPGATRSPKSAPIKTPVRWVEGGRVGGRGLRREQWV